MIPWWGVLIACVGFAFWSMICFLLGAGMRNLADPPKQRPVNPKMN